MPNRQILVMVMAGARRGGEVLVHTVRAPLPYCAPEEVCSPAQRTPGPVLHIITQPGVCHKFLSQFSLNVLCCVLACGGRAVCGEVW